MKRADSWDSLIQYHAARHGLDWKLMKAQMLAESAGDPEAVSPVGARGLTQFMPKTWWEWWDQKEGIEGPPPPDERHNPDKAIGAQAAYLAYLFRVFRPRSVGRDLTRSVLAAYNWGMGRVLKHLAASGGVIERNSLPVETDRYIAAIEKKLDELGG